MTPMKALEAESTNWHKLSCPAAASVPQVLGCGAAEALRNPRLRGGLEGPGFMPTRTVAGVLGDVIWAPMWAPILFLYDLAYGNAAPSAPTF